MQSTLLPQLPSKEGRILLAAAALKNNSELRVQRAASLYDTPRSTLQDRLAGALLLATSNAKKRKLLPTEEQALIQWILDLDKRGFPPQVIDVRRMANILLTARGQIPPPQPIGKCWVSRFIKSQPELQTKWNRKFHSQRALCEDPVIIGEWFQRVRETRQAYGILDEDIYNFDETGFMMGVAATSKIVTSSNTIGRAMTVQPGNRDWVTTIEGINMSGWSIPPFVILAGKVHQASWYHDLPPDWVLAVSDNGWTNDQLGIEWIKHFDKHTSSRIKGVYRLLILDGHGSHITPEFDEFCSANRIISLCMPAHTSHLLQPLDVSCFSPLKAAYGREIQKLARLSIFHIDKNEFLSAYARIRNAIFTE